MSKQRENPAVRIAFKSRLSGDCVIWCGLCDRDGYGVIGIGRAKQYRVHRIVWELAYGEIPSGMLVCHKCDNPPCVRLEHLFLGTPKDNTQDMLLKGRKVTPRGEAHPNCKVTDSDVEMIRQLRSNGVRLSTIAEQFSISFQHVGAVCKGVYRASH